MEEKFQHNVDTVASHIDETFSKGSIERYFPKRWQEMCYSATIKRIKDYFPAWALGHLDGVKENNLCSVKAVDGQHCMKGKSFDHQL